MKIEVAALSHIGKRKKSNQDRMLIRIGEWNDNEFGLFVVADGMGGFSHGEKAAEIAIEEAERWWHSDLKLLIETSRLKEEHILATLHELLHEIHFIIRQESESLGSTMGTTVTILLLIDACYYTAHLGDSRIYKITDTILRITKDHTWVQSELEAGRLSEAEASIHPRRNVLMQCAGMPSPPQVEMHSGSIQGRSSFLICSDGFYHYIKETDLGVLMGLNEDQLESWLTQKKVEILAQEAHDNLTAIALRI